MAASALRPDHPLTVPTVQCGTSSGQFAAREDALRRELELAKASLEDERRERLSAVGEAARLRESMAAAEVRLSALSLELRESNAQRLNVTVELETLRSSFGHGEPALKNGDSGHEALSVDSAPPACSCEEAASMLMSCPAEPRVDGGAVSQLCAREIGWAEMERKRELELLRKESPGGCEAAVALAKAADKDRKRCTGELSRSTNLVGLLKQDCSAELRREQAKYLENVNQLRKTADAAMFQLQGRADAMDKRAKVAEMRMEHVASGAKCRQVGERAAALGVELARAELARLELQKEYLKSADEMASLREAAAAAEKETSAAQADLERAMALGRKMAEVAEAAEARAVATLPASAPAFEDNSTLASCSGAPAHSFRDHMDALSRSCRRAPLTGLQTTLCSVLLHVHSSMEEEEAAAAKAAALNDQEDGASAWFGGVPRLFARHSLAALDDTMAHALQGMSFAAKRILDSWRAVCPDGLCGLPPAHIAASA